MELKLMMEKLGAPQTHLGLKNMIKEVDEDFDGKLSFREVHAITESNRFEAEIRQEQEEKKKEAEDKKQRQAAFKDLKSAFNFCQGSPPSQSQSAMLTVTNHTWQSLELGTPPNGFQLGKQQLKLVKLTFA
ncbi:UNVERIFIED_CONTAM: hypothetical protein FKN15_001973 [Acipenser sinensis]